MFEVIAILRHATKEQLFEITKEALKRGILPSELLGTELRLLIDQRLKKAPEKDAEHETS